MKKYLMSGVAAIAFLAAFTSCSKTTDLYDQGAVDEKNKQEQQKKELTINEKYAAAFENAFGKVAPTVDWGFGAKAASSGTRASSYGIQNIEPIFKFPTAPENSAFPTERDKNAELLTGYKSGTNLIYYIDENANSKSIQPDVAWDASKKDLVLYVEGNVTPSDIYTPAKTTIYLLPNSKLTIPANRKSFGQNYTHIYIGTGAELIIQGDFVEFGSGVKVYNKGTVTAENIYVSNDGLLYNMGNITTNELSVKNSSSVIVNDYKVTANYLNTAGGGKIQNNYEMTIKGETNINSNDNTWVNNGHYKTNTFVYTAGSADVINNCYLEVLEDFDINLGDNMVNGFRIDGGGSVKTLNFNGGGPFTATNDKGETKTHNSGPYKIVMGSGALFKVTNEAHLNATASGITTAYYGFQGAGDDYAVFQAKKVLKEGKGHGNVAYTGNLYVVAEEHFENETNGYSDGCSAILFKYGCTRKNIYAPGFESGLPDVNIPKTSCSDGFEGEATATYRVIAEDLNAEQKSDFDFNDVVFDVEPNEDGTAAKIVLQAAGGIYKLTVGDETHGIREIHEAFGASADPTTGLYPMINTENYDPNLAVILFESYSGNFDTDANIRATIKNIPIIVYKPVNGEILPCTLTATTGEPACKILVDKSFDIVKERQDISNQYQKFTKYVGGFVDDFWWK